jgi:hypothetical protein
MSYGDGYRERRRIGWGCVAATALVLGLLIVIGAPAILMLRERADRAASANKLREIGVGLASYAKDRQHLPPHALQGEDGRPLLSWRVAVLPYIEPKGIAAEFHRDEPWDSRHNEALLSKLPVVYKPVGIVEAPPSSTFYQVFVGPGTAFAPKTQVSLADIAKGDGLSYTILVVEAGDAVPWSKPADLPYVPDQPLPPLGGLFPGQAGIAGLGNKPGFHALFADGSVRFFTKDTGEAVIRNLITLDAGEKEGAGDKPK